MFRYLAACVAALCLVAQFSSFAHMLLVRHATCPDHGELIHANEEGGSASIERGQLANASEEQVPAFEARRDAASEHGHDHCAVLANRRDSTTLTAAQSPVLIGPPGLSGIQDHQEDLRPVSFALYLLAPKNSPPA
jgi:hypothetical protein